MEGERERARKEEDEDKMYILTRDNSISSLPVDMRVELMVGCGV